MPESGLVSFSALVQLATLTSVRKEGRGREEERKNVGGGKWRDGEGREGKEK